jgi:hypothetical protein
MDLPLAVVVRGGDVGVVQKQEPLVAVMSQVFRQALDVSVPLRFASHLRQLPFQLRGPSLRVRRSESANRRSNSAIQASRSRHPAHAVNDPGRSSMMADFLQNPPQITKTIPAAW